MESLDVKSHFKKKIHLKQAIREFIFCNVNQIVNIGKYFL